jgi:hypothetical protein
MRKDQLIFSRFLIFMSLIACILPVQADIFGSGDELEIWRSNEKFIKLESQSGDKIPPNDHPVTLDASKITHALKILEFWEKGGVFSRDKQNYVFSDGQASILGVRIAEGLIKAKANQDLTFALAKLETISLGMKDRAYTAGRVFYKDGRLNIIIGDFNRPPDKGMEQAAASAGQSVSEFTYVFDTGKRFRQKKRDFNVITGNGVELHDSTEGRKQRDWIVIDLDAASRFYVQQQEKNDPDKKATAQQEALEHEAARISQERRELRMEMARMRKEMQELSDGDAGASAKSIEERIATLDELLGKKLITKEEYEQRRMEILSDI